MRRVFAGIVATATAVAVVTACDPLGRPSLEPAFGARDLDGRLGIWTGAPCHDVIELGLTFDPNKEDRRAEFLMNAPNGVGVDVDHFTLGEPVPGLTVTTPLAPDFDWRQAESVRISVIDSRETGGWGTTTKIAEVVEGSAEHPEDTYWFQAVGWLNPTEVAAQDGKTFLSTCTPSP
jgi:hypothetical protein